jgi:hypothetical protein
MTRFPHPLLFLATALLFAGCANSKNAAEVSQQKTKIAESRIEVFDGPGGAVAIGDSSEKFSQAFPRPKGAVDPESPALEGVQFVGWQNEKEMASAAIQDGKIVALYHGVAKAEAGWIADARARFGKAVHDVSNDLGAFANWKRGDKELVIMLQQGAGGGITIRVVGTSDMLKKLRLNSDELASTLEAQGRSISGSGGGGAAGHSPDDGHGH